MPPGHEYPISPPPQTETVGTAEKRGWTHRHPYLAATIAVASLACIFLSVLTTRSGVGANENGRNWVGAGSVSFTGGRNTTESERLKAEETVKQLSHETELGYIPIASPIEEADAGGKYSNDLTALLAQLVQPTSGKTPLETSAETPNSFSFIPQGLISIANPERQLTPEAEALKTYGNTIGAHIQGFESMHSNSAQILKDHAEDRENTEKAERVSRLGYDIAELGRDLTLITDVPDIAKAAHSALATSYRIVGTNLTKIAATKTDEEFLGAINTYNASVEALSKRFFVLISIFTANSVTFSSSEPGSVFMFNSTFAF